MPKRTNPFQNLVARIFKARDDDNTIVVESATVQENGMDLPAEIDVLISKTVDGQVRKIAIECRDHARPQSVPWIRELANKKSSMRLAAVKAVSTSGFTKGARQKAAVEGIQLLTLKEAIDIEWGKEFLKIDLTKVVFDLRLIAVNFRLEGDDPPAEPLVGTTPVVGDPDLAAQTVQGLIDAVISRRPPDMANIIHAAIASGRTIADLHEPARHIRRLVFGDDAFVQGRRLAALDLHYVLVASTEPLDVDRYLLDDARATQAVLSDGRTQFSLLATQWKDKQDAIALSIETVDSATGAGGRLVRKTSSRTPPTAQ